jgi:SpoVK/Ycf46/Vps4 family AAA+-type ATPase
MTNKRPSNNNLEDNSDRFFIKKSKIDNYYDDMIYLNREINDIDDLIFLGEQYRPEKKYNINLEKLYKLIPVLTKLKKVIGMENVKRTIINQIIYFIQDFQEKNSDMLHTVIQGPPGVGKTMLGEIIGEIYYRLDIIQQPENNPDKKEDKCCGDEETDNDTSSHLDFKFTIAKRSDLIGKYLGHTAAKTQEVINKSLGGVLFIDEAYSLGNPEGRDSFSKECIDTINQNLTEKKNQLLLIIAGYKDALDTCFFSYNEGLRRRFPFIYTIDRYKPDEMSKILHKMINNLGQDWEIKVEDDTLIKFFDKNMKMFPNSAGDIETLVFNIKIEHSKRVFCQPPGSKLRRKINKTDIDNALKIYISNKEKKNKNEIPEWLKHLYV